ncbi:cupin domain-containing protein [Halobaculum litoreum]|uniref:Cupin domain-containing protein n=1 Tax=Halobaculum litoreum TaxID=3031998 RepID=A0ABD5XNA0_9EURY|nr:cupin domain-containing protein [Halobaculum sp. DT92]
MAPRDDASDRTYRRLSVADDGAGPAPERVERLLAEAAGDAPVDAAVREVAPGDSLAPATHRGTPVERLLFVLAGELRLPDDGASLRVGANEAVVVPPEPPAPPVAVGDEPCRYLAFGAP